MTLSEVFGVYKEHQANPINAVWVCVCESVSVCVCVCNPEPEFWMLSHYIDDYHVTLK